MNKIDYNNMMGKIIKEIRTEIIKKDPINKLTTTLDELIKKRKMAE